mgnify:CR=1 FL=1
MMRFLIINIARNKNISKNANSHMQELWKIVTSETFKINVLNLINVTKKEEAQIEKDRLESEKSLVKRGQFINERKKNFRSMLSQFMKVEGALPPDLLEDKTSENEEEDRPF